VTLWKAC